MGAVDHGGFLRFPSLTLGQIVAYACPWPAQGRADGSSFMYGTGIRPVAGSGRGRGQRELGEFYQREVTFEPRAEVADVLAVFVNDQQASGLMNVDWIEFLPPSGVESSQPLTY